MKTHNDDFTVDDMSPATPEMIVVQDTAGEAQVIIEDDLPDEAFEMLFRLDSSSVPAGVLRYDRSSGRWVDLGE